MEVLEHTSTTTAASQSIEVKYNARQGTLDKIKVEPPPLPPRQVFQVNFLVLFVIVKLGVITWCYYSSLLKWSFIHMFQRTLKYWKNNIFFNRQSTMACHTGCPLSAPMKSTVRWWLARVVLARSTWRKYAPGVGRPSKRPSRYHIPMTIMIWSKKLWFVSYLVILKF